MKRVLLAEDDPFLIDVYTTKLKEVGFKVDVAKDGQIALDFLQKNKPDILLLDIILPRIDGWEILKKIKQEHKFKDLPIIILSNLGQKQEVEKSLALGATKYLIKAHYTPAEIVKEIRKLLK